MSLNYNSETNDDKLFLEGLDNEYGHKRDLFLATPDLYQKLLALPQEHPEQHKQETQDTSTPTSWWKWLSLPVLAAAACAVAFVIWKSPNSSFQPDVLTPKGVSWSMLYAHAHPGQTKGMLSHKAQNGTVLAPNDFIQFSYLVPKTLYVMVAGINQRGQRYILIHNNNQSVRVRPGKGFFPTQNGKVKSFQLDDFIGLERFLFVASYKPFSWKVLQQEIQKSWLQQNQDIQKFKLSSKAWLYRSIWIRKQARVRK